MIYMLFATIAIFALLFIGMIWTGFLASPTHEFPVEGVVMGSVRNKAWDSAVSRARNRHHG